VALLEAAKGAVVVLVGLGLLALIHRDVQSVAEEVVRHLHLNPAMHYPRIFLDAASRLTDARLWVLAATALLYSLVRFTEAYGLWRQREWAVWFGILSGGIYLPVEAYELARSFSAIKVGIVIANLFVVGWLAWYRWRGR
jgi:uncharacterized membrane protein (DUF2068 family)